MLGGDTDTGAGLTVTEGRTARTPIPFSYKDSDGEYKAGILYADNLDPTYKGRAEGDFLNNNRAIPVRGAEIASDNDPTINQRLGYESTVDFLNSLSPESDFKLDFSAVVDDEDTKGAKWDIVQNAFTNERGKKVYPVISKEADTENDLFMKNLRQLMKWTNSSPSSDSPAYFNGIADKQYVYGDDKERRIFSPEIPGGTTSLYKWLTNNRTEGGL